MDSSRDIVQLIEVMAALRTPGTGCPWDLEQDFASIAPYTIEEAYEVADAIARGDLDELRDELGDLLLQVVFHSQMAAEIGAFDFGDVCRAITRKMIRRHPHVFASEAVETDKQSVRKSWDEIKAEEKAGRAAAGRDNGPGGSILDDIPVALPALTRAVKLQKRAGRVGFDWNEPAQVIDKIREETEELAQAVAGGAQSDMEEEIGDLLFAVANLARHLDVDPESALRAATAKFTRRFSHIEQRAAAAERALSAIPLDQMESWWQEAKAEERE